jgi:hypothetical protein
MNRRTILADAATATVPATVVIPSFAASDTLAESCSHPDLARAFNALYDRWVLRTQKDRKNVEQFRRQLFELTVLAPHECPSPIKMDADLQRLCEKASSGIEDGPCDQHGCSLAWNEIHGTVPSLRRDHQATGNHLGRCGVTSAGGGIAE